jgi:hypothetical protein
MKIYSIEVETDLGRLPVKPSVPLVVEPIGDMPPHFRKLTVDLWDRVRIDAEAEEAVKIYFIEVGTDFGRRVVQLAAPMDIDPTGDMPPHFRSLTELLWGVLREVAIQPPVLTLKAEA